MRSPFRSMAAAAAAVLAVTLAGCASSPQVRVDKDPTADLRSYRTFSFYDHPATNPNGYTSIVTQRLEASTRNRLEALGYTYRERDADLRVNFVLKVADRQELRSTPSGVGIRPYRSWSSGLETVSYREGTLRIDLVDAKRNALVWQGVAEGRLDAAAGKQASTVIDSTVGEILARFGEKKGS